jgi:flagellar M-ring protein FliF
MKALLQGLLALGPARLGAMGAVAIGMLGMLSLMVLRGGSGDMALLYGDLDMRDSAQVVEQLSRGHIAYRLGGGGSEVLVPADQVADARLLLARVGLPAGGSVGYEIFDKSDGLAASDFQQRINQTRALEGELARTIRAMQGVRAVRVHLVLPRREPFARDQQEAQASVLLTMAGVGRLDREGVQAILNLVASAVPGLRPHNIALVDSRGDLLARTGAPVDAAGGEGQATTAASAEELRRGTELRLARAVEEMLEKSLGQGHVRAEASVRMSFDHLNQTEERYDPDSQVARSAQSVTSSNKSTEQAAAVTVQNNLPNADAGHEGTGSQEQRQEETTNYEISKTVRTLIRDQPQIDHISLAVMVDGTDAVDGQGKHSWQPRPAEELERIASLVKSAIGFDEKRGDHVDVVSMQFAPEPMPTPEAGGLFGMRLEKADILHLAQTALFGMVGVVLLLLVLRPMVLRLTSLGATGAPVRLLGGATALPAALTGAAPGTALPAPAAAALLEDESMVNIAQVEGQMRASSLRKITELVEKHPEETLSIVRGWMVQENS